MDVSDATSCSGEEVSTDRSQQGRRAGKRVASRAGEGKQPGVVGKDERRGAGAAGKRIGVLSCGVTLEDAPGIRPKVSFCVQDAIAAHLTPSAGAGMESRARHVNAATDADEAR
eukprot:925825-Rhodomonas_salina.2